MPDLVKHRLNLQESAQNSLQISAVTGMDCQLSGAEAKAIFRIVSTMRLYAQTRGLPQDLIDLLTRP